MPDPERVPIGPASLLQPPEQTPPVAPQATEPPGAMSSAALGVTDEETKLRLGIAADVRRQALSLDDFEKIGGEVTQGGPADLRLKLSFASTPEQQQGVLDQYFGKGMWGMTEQDGYLWYIDQDGKAKTIEDLSTKEGTLLPFRASLPGLGDVADVTGALPVAIGGTAGEIMAGPHGAFLGSALANVAKEEFGTKFLGVPPRPPGEVAKESLIEGGIGGVLSGITAGQQRVLGGTELEQGAKAAARVFEESGASMLPGQMSKSRLVDVLQNVADVAIFKPKLLSRIQERQAAAVPKLVDDFIETLSPRLGEGGRMPESLFTNYLKSALQGGRDVAEAIYEPLYKEVSNATRGFKAYATDIRDSAKIIFYKELRVPSDLDESAIRKAFGDKIAQAKAQIDLLPKDKIEMVDGVPTVTERATIDFETAKVIRSNLSALTVKATDQENRVIVPLLKAVEDEMEAIAKRGGPNTWKLYKKANAIFHESSTMFNESFLAKAAKKEGRMLGKTAFDIQDVAQARKLRSIVLRSARRGERGIRGKAIQDLQAGYANELWNRSAVNDPVTGAKTFSGRKMLDWLDEIGTKERGEVIKVLFPGKEGTELVARWRSLAEAIEFTQRKPISSGRGMFQLAQSGAIIAALRFGDPSTAVPIILGPAVIGYLMAFKPTAKLLTDGFLISPGTRTAATFTNRFLAEINKKRFVSMAEETGKFIGETATSAARLAVREIQARRGIPQPSQPPTQ